MGTNADTLAYGRRYIDAWSYIYGGDRFYPERYGGTDCSGFVHAAFFQCRGIEVGTWTGGQYYSSASEKIYEGNGSWNNVPWSTMKPGDIILMSSDSSTFSTGTGSHVAIYTGVPGVVLDVGSTPCVKERNITWYNAIAICVKRVPETSDERKPFMQCIIRPNGIGRLDWFDGTQIHPLLHIDELEAVQKVAEATLGYRLPVFQLGTNAAPWGSRFYDAVGSKDNWRHEVPTMRK